MSSLSHPLPSGMRDLLPEEAETQGILASDVLTTFELFGYQQVSLPAFEYADVLERGLGTIDPGSMLRFVEPETGEVVALRPDMTPQVARLVATRLSSQPSPIRLGYRGSVLRRQHERARHDQQALQAGIELIGTGGTDADLEVIAVCTEAVRRAGLDAFVLDLGHGGISAALLADLEQTERELLLESLSLKDSAELARRAQRIGLDGETTVSLVGLLSLQGGKDVFSRAQEILGATPAWEHVEELARLYCRVEDDRLAAQIVVDLGESRAATYYTGPTFQILAEGPGQAVASGGRYDELYGQFGAARPAAGGAIQLDHLRWALGPLSGRQRIRVFVCASPESQDTKAVSDAVQALRKAGITSISGASDSALDYARAWRYSHIARVGAEASRVHITRLDCAAEVDLGKQSLLSFIKSLRP